MSGLTNVVDAMLVFACGLMLALVAYWNVDITPAVNEVEAVSMTEVDSDSIEHALDSMQGGSGYTQLGMVYEDPITGKLYMITDDLKESTGGTASATATSGAEGAASGGATGSNPLADDAVD